MEDNAALVELAKNEAADLVVVGPEVPLVNGLADDLIAADIPVFGPNAAAARLEGSKAFARDFCDRHNIPQPKWQNFTKAEAATALCSRYEWLLRYKGRWAGGRQRRGYLLEFPRSRTGHN